MSDTGFVGHHHFTVMKRVKLIIFSFVLFTPLLLGQTDKYQLAFEGGPAVTFLRGFDKLKEATDPTVNFSFGATFQYAASPGTALRTGLLFQKKGAVFSGSSANSYIRYNYSYLTLPMMIRFSTRSKVKLYVDLGFFMGYLLKQNIVGKTEYSSDKESYDNTDKNRRFDAGLITGVGVLIPLDGKTSFSIEVRNDLGLYDTHEELGPSSQPIFTNSTNFMVGFVFDVGKEEKESDER